MPCCRRVYVLVVRKCVTQGVAFMTARIVWGLSRLLPVYVLSGTSPFYKRYLEH